MQIASRKTDKAPRVDMGPLVDSYLCGTPVSWFLGVLSHALCFGLIISEGEGVGALTDLDASVGTGNEYCRGASDRNRHVEAAVFGTVSYGG